MSPNGELLQAIPIYSNETGALFNSQELNSITGSTDIPKNVSLGIYEHMGFMLYHPSQPFSFYMKSLDLFEDLGKL